MPQHHRAARARAACTETEVEAAARQYVRKVSGLTKPTGAAVEAFERAVAEVAAATSAARGAAVAPQSPATVPPLRRPEVRARARPRHRLTKA